MTSRGFPSRGLADVPIRAILFDKDGTLIDFQRTWGPATHAVIAHFAAGDQAIYDRLAAASGFVAGERRFVAGSPLIAGATPDYGHLWAQVLGRPATGDFFAEIDRLFHVSGLEHLKPIGEPPAVLGGLRRRGYRLGIITNDAEANARAHLRDLADLYRITPAEVDALPVHSVSRLANGGDGRAEQDARKTGPRRHFAGSRRPSG